MALEYLDREDKSINEKTITGITFVTSITIGHKAQIRNAHSGVRVAATRYAGWALFLDSKSFILPSKSMS